MTMTRLPGGLWAPVMPPRFFNNSLLSTRDDALLDADEEEAQFVGTVCLAGGPGTSKTFGTSGSTLYWRAGAAITFASGSTLRLGIKNTLDAANGPPGRATIGAAAFNVYKDLVGGTDTISSNTWYETSMASGTPFTMTHGDNIAICFHLDTTSGTPSIKISSEDTPNASAGGYPLLTLVTSGPTYTGTRGLPLIIIKFDDGTIGWIDGSFIYTSSTTETIGNTNLYGNLITPAYNIKVDAVAALITPGGTTNFDVGFWSDPSGTPTKVTGCNLSIDPQYLSAAVLKAHIWSLPTEMTLNSGTAYLLGVGQNSATAITMPTYDVNDAAHFQANGLDGDKCYAVKSTAGAAVASQNSGKRRAGIFMRISQIDNGAGGAGGLLTHPGMSGGMRG